MYFTVSQISQSVELVFANSDDFINVYPSYHQSSGLVYVNVNRADWSISGTQYRWETTYYDINTETVPVIQLVYSYNATQTDKQAQYSAFRTIKAVETTDGKLYLYANSVPAVDFRIRYRLLNKLDLAIPLNRLFSVGLGYGAGYEQLTSYLTSVNPVTGQNTPLASNIPAATLGKAGIMTGDILPRLLKLEDNYNSQLTQPYCIIGYDSAAGVTPITTYYADITSIQAVPADTWYKECELWTKTDASDFTTAVHMFYQQQATVLNLTHIYTGNVTTFSYALAANVLLQNIVGLQLMDTHNATDISYMFAGDTALETLDLSACCLNQVTDIEGLFKNCISLQEIDVTSIDFTKIGTGNIPLIEQDDVFTGIPNDCTIWVSGETQRNAIIAEYPNLTGITYN